MGRALTRLFRYQAKGEAAELLPRVVELERLAHDQPELDQMLAALREQAEALTELYELPLWRNIAWWRAYRRCRAAHRRYQAERNLLHSRGVDA